MADDLQAINFKRIMKQLTDAASALGYSIAFPDGADSDMVPFLILGHEENLEKLAENELKDYDLQIYSKEVGQT